MDKITNKIAKNFTFNVIYNALNVLFPVITIPYLSRILLADGLGKVSYATNIVSWFILFASMGIPRYGIREVAREKNRELDKTFSELFFLNLLSTSIAIIVFVLILCNVGYFRNKLSLYLVLGIQLFLNVFNVDWLYQGLEDFQFITIRSFFVKLISLILMFIFVKSHDDYLIYALIQSLAIAGNNVLNFLHSFNYCKLQLNNLSFRRHLKPIVILLATQLAISVYALLDITMLGLQCSEKYVGYYTNVQKVINMLSVMTASLGGVLLPELVLCFRNNNFTKLKNIAANALEIIITFTIPISLGIILISRELVVVFFGKNFYPAILTLKLYAPFIFISTVGNLFGTQLLMTFNMEKELFITTLIGALTNFSLNLILIPLFKHNGATISTIISESCVTIAQIYYVEKKCRIVINAKSLLSSIVSVINMVLCILIIHSIIDGFKTQLFLNILIGSIIYLVTCKLLGNRSINSIEKFILKKIDR